MYNAFLKKTPQKLNMDIIGYYSLRYRGLVADKRMLIMQVLSALNISADMHIMS